jgi:hypothetical protein
MAAVEVRKGEDYGTTEENGLEDRHRSRVWVARPDRLAAAILVHSRWSHSWTPGSGVVREPIISLLSLRCAAIEVGMWHYNGYKYAKENL